MKKITLGLPILAVLLSASNVSAAPVPISGSIVFNSAPAGLYGNWDVTFTGVSPEGSLTLSSLGVTLGANLYIDTTPIIGAAFLENSAGFYSSGAPPDSATSMNLAISGLASGQHLNFNLDVDQTCVGNVGQLIVCNIVTVGGQIVNGNRFANGTGFTVGFTGTNIVGQNVTVSFLNASGNLANFSISGTVEAVPEPASFAMLGGGLLALGLASRKFRKT